MPIYEIEITVDGEKHNCMSVGPCENDKAAAIEFCRAMDGDSLRPINCWNTREWEIVSERPLPIKGVNHFLIKEVETKDHS